AAPSCARRPFRLPRRRGTSRTTDRRSTTRWATVRISSWCSPSHRKTAVDWRKASRSRGSPYIMWGPASPAGSGWKNRGPFDHWPSWATFTNCVDLLGDRLMRRLAAILVLLFASSSLLRAEEWPAWRGPYLDGTTSEARAPIHWGPTENIR